jgi:bifunctional N-acetylglucosamine-1-phosphate-uridyltransferase/glucosamine-1-phosphate-acetyltransferase GlmU-like protein
LGLLSQVPLAKGLNKGKGAAEEEDLSDLVSGYGQIIRDAEGNVIDIILPEEPQEEDDDEEKELPKVEAKTAIAKSEYCARLRLSVAHCQRSSFLNQSWK